MTRSCSQNKAMSSTKLQPRWGHPNFATPILPFAFAVSHMDRVAVVDDAQLQSKQSDVFNKIVGKVCELARRIGFGPADFCVVPYSAKTLENIETPGYRSFFQGPPLLDAIAECVEQYQQSLRIAPMVPLEHTLLAPSMKRDCVTKCEVEAVIVYGT